MTASHTFLFNFIIHKITRWVALMIQLEQQQHGEFVGGWGGGWGGGLHQLPISSSLGLDQQLLSMFSVGWVIF